MACVSLRALADVIGAPLARRLIASTPRTAGRRHLYVPIPANLHAEHRLAQVIGMTAARELAHAYPGEILELPRHVTNPTEFRKEIVFDLWARGKTAREIHAAFPRVSFRTIRNDVAELRRIYGIED